MRGVGYIAQRILRLARAASQRARDGKQTRRYKTTTKRNKAHLAAPNLLKRNFSADRPDQKWLADITYIPTLEGWLYLALVLDLYTRGIVGWAMLDRMTGDLTLAALKMALQRRQPSLKPAQPGAAAPSASAARTTSAPVSLNTIMFYLGPPLRLRMYSLYATMMGKCSGQAHTGRLAHSKDRRYQHQEGKEKVAHPVKECRRP